MGKVPPESFAAREGGCAVRIVIAGGTGQVGSMLARHFHRNGHAVVVLSRSLRKAPWMVVRWDGFTAGPWIKELDRSDALSNLAGRNVNCRYTPKNRQAILESRIHATQVLHQAVAAIRNPPPVWINASTATIYRHALTARWTKRRGIRRGRARGPRYLEFFDSGGKGLGTGLLLHRDSRNQAGRSPKRHDLQP
jgi:uncharacterized protein